MVLPGVVDAVNPEVIASLHDADGWCEIADYNYALIRNHGVACQPVCGLDLSYPAGSGSEPGGDTGGPQASAVRAKGIEA
jgi:hypothetical protein